MSKEQAKEFFEEISKNQQLSQEVAKIVGGKNSDEAKAKELISLAKEHGFNFTQKEAASAQGELKKSLSPEELLEVSGGKGGFKSSLMAMALLAGLGVGGAAMSSMEASAMDGDNHQEIQVPGGQAAEQQQEGNAQPGQQQQGAEGNQEQPGQQNAAAQDEQQQWVFDGWHTVDAGHYIEVQGPGAFLATGDSDRGLVEVRGDRLVKVTGPGQRGVFVDGDRLVEVCGSGEKVVAVAGDRPVQVLGPGERFVAVFGDREVQVNGPGQRGVFVNGDRDVRVDNPGQRGVFVHGDRDVFVHGPGQRGVFVDGDRLVQVDGQGQQPVAVFGDRPVKVVGPGERFVAVFGDRPVEVTGPGQRAVGVFGDRPVFVYGQGQQPVGLFGDRPVLVHGAGVTRINRPGGHGAGELPEIYVDEPVLQNPDRGPQEAPVYAPRNVFLHEVGTATINGAQQAYINCPCDVTHSATGGNLRVTGNTLIRTEGNNHITAGENSHITSFSQHEVEHQGMGGVRVDPVGDSADILIGAAAGDGVVGRDVTIENANDVAVNGAVSLSVTAVGDGGISISSDATVTHSAQHGQLNVTGGAVINAEGANRINAYEDTTIASTSANLLTHDGDGGVVIDGASIEVSGSSLEQVERDVTVTMANSVTVNSGITMRTRNGEGFPMGETLQKTAENILRALTPNSLQEILSKFGSSGGSK